MDRGQHSVSLDVGGGAGQCPSERFAALLFPGKENGRTTPVGSYFRLLLRKIDLRGQRSFNMIMGVSRNRKSCQGGIEPLTSKNTDA